MRGSLAVVVTMIFLGGCSEASAVPPDSNNPAHCMAAFAYGANVFRKADRADLAAQWMTRATAELDKAAASGRPRNDVIAESRLFAKAFIAENNQEQMDKLVHACMAHRDAAH